MFGALFCFGVLFVKTTVESFFGVFFFGTQLAGKQTKDTF